jgi:hypothetical protein
MESPLEFKRIRIGPLEPRSIVSEPLEQLDSLREFVLFLQ